MRSRLKNVLSDADCYAYLLALILMDKQVNIKNKPFTNKTDDHQGCPIKITPSFRAYRGISRTMHRIFLQGILIRNGSALSINCNVVQNQTIKPVGYSARLNKRIDHPKQ